MLILDRRRSWLTNEESELSIGCYDGWHDLIVSTIDAMVETVQPDGRFRIRQIKEKFDGLRVYVSTSGDWQALSDIADKAGRRSCETCGAPGRLREFRGWCFTACDAHAQRRW